MIQYTFPTVSAGILIDDVLVVEAQAMKRRGGNEEP